jgi:hypothetical protein
MYHRFFEELAMGETLRMIDIGVDTADAEAVELEYRRGGLSLRYIDMAERPRERFFTNVLAFRWDDNEHPDMPRDDVCYEVLGSAWLAAQPEAGPQGRAYSHYRLCFNACGTLDVLCASLAGED